MLITVLDRGNCRQQGYTFVIHTELQIFTSMLDGISDILRKLLKSAIPILK